jgi:two-component system, chemotaxis family, chemotaxis protein CheY
LATPEVVLSETSRKRVLVVEDSALMRDMIGFALKGVAVDVTKAQNGLEGLERASLEQFDLVLTDVVMPEIGGIEFIRSLRQMPGYGSVPVVIVSTQGARDAIDEGLAAGANDYLTKPFKPQDLVRVIRRHLEGSIR